MGKALFYVISKRLACCQSDEEVRDEWNRIWDEIIMIHRSFVDNNTCRVPVEDNGVKVFEDL